MLTRVLAYLASLVAVLIVLGVPAALLYKVIGTLFGYKFWTGVLFTIAFEVFVYLVASFLTKKLEGLRRKLRGGW